MNHILRSIRKGDRKASGADMNFGRPPIGENLVPTTASGRRTMSSLRSSRPGLCGSRPGGHSLRSFVPPRWSSVPRATMQSHKPGLRPGAQRAPRLRSARSRPRPSEAVPHRVYIGRQFVTAAIDPLSVLPAFSGMCWRFTVARDCEFCFGSPLSYDAMDFVGSAPWPLAAHGRLDPIGRLAAAGTTCGVAAQDAALPDDARSAFIDRRQLGSGDRGSRRFASGVRHARHSTHRRRQAGTHQRPVTTLQKLSQTLDVLGRCPEGGPVTDPSNRDSSRTPQVYRLFAVIISPTLRKTKTCPNRQPTNQYMSCAVAASKCPSSRIRPAAPRFTRQPYKKSIAMMAARGKRQVPSGGMICPSSSDCWNARGSGFSTAKQNRTKSDFQAASPVGDLSSRSQSPVGWVFTRSHSPISYGKEHTAEEQGRCRHEGGGTTPGRDGCDQRSAGGGAQAGSDTPCPGLFGEHLGERASHSGQAKSLLFDLSGEVL